MKGRRILLFVVLFGVVFASVNRSVVADSNYISLWGAFGNSNAAGNSGVQAEIKTDVYNIVQPDILDSFFVANPLANGAALTFGYGLVVPGTYCLLGEQSQGVDNCSGSESFVGSGDARWLWNYWPNPNVHDFYYGMGPANSAGSNGTWHTYQITPNAANGWNFVLDGQVVSSFNKYASTISKSPPIMVAEEESTTTSVSGNLGPVEFRNLQYLMNGEWRPVTSLTAMLRCGNFNQFCGIYAGNPYGVPYGVSLIAPNDILVGSGQYPVPDGTLLWGNPYVILEVPKQVQVTIDGTIQPTGTAQVTLRSGTHTFSVPNFVQLDNGTGLRFDHWNAKLNTGNTVATANFTVEIESNFVARAVYVTQYELTIVSSQYSAGSQEWYDKGSTANYSVNNQFLPIIFVGWYDESGNLITNSTAGTILMDGPHTLVPEWRINYPVIAICSLATAGVVTTVIISRRSPRKPRVQTAVTQPPSVNPTENIECGKCHQVIYTPVGQIDENAFNEATEVHYTKSPQCRPTQITSLAPADQPKSVMAYCITCGKQLPVGAKFCNECGSKQP